MKLLLLNMHGPYSLTLDSIDSYVEEKIGNYALGVAHGITFAVKYVGRSDSNVNKRLKDHVRHQGYTHFKYSYSTDAIQAYQKECADYHAFVDNGFALDNEIHPAKPEGASPSLACPTCGQ
jgi:hypothetical protein